jgi:hypothetical protein
MMKLPAINFLFLLLTGLLLHNKATAQTEQSDSAFLQTAINNAIAVYRQSETDQSRLNNGRQYKPYTFTFIKGFPFFLTNQSSRGSIIYDGGFYDNIQLLYDEIKEMLILDIGVRLELINERVDQFTISGHTFIRLQKDSVNNLAGTGFYERLYSGNIDVYKKEKKSIKEVLSTTEGTQAEALEKKYYYLKKDNRYYPVKRKGDMLDVLRDKKNEIQQYINKNNLNFKQDTDHTLATIAAYYDQLTK